MQHFLTLFFVLLTLAAQAQVAFTLDTGARIAISSDGNDNDTDDIGATPMSLALIKYGGYQGNLVHYDFNSYIWSIDSVQVQENNASVSGAISYWGYDSANVFYDAYADSTAARTHLKNAMLASTASSPLYVIYAGPGSTIIPAYIDAKAEDANAMYHVYLITHSPDNENQWAPNGTHPCNKMSGCLDTLVVNLIDVNNQNNTHIGADGSYSAWTWLRDTTDTGLAWLHTRMKEGKSNKPDVSDAGMTYYMLTGDNPISLDSTIVDNIRWIFNNPQDNTGCTYDPGAIASTATWSDENGSIGAVGSSIEIGNRCGENIDGTFSNFIPEEGDNEIIILHKVDGVVVGSDTLSFTVTDTTSGGTPTEVFVDDVDAGFSSLGNWNQVGDGNDKYGPYYLYISAGDTTKYAQWDADLVAGTYEVFINYDDGGSRSTSMKVEITHSGGTATTTINQNSGGGTWQSLGTYTFGTTGRVKLYNGANGNYNTADAVKFTPN